MQYESRRSKQERQELFTMQEAVLEDRKYRFPSFLVAIEISMIDFMKNMETKNIKNAVYVYSPN